MNSPWQWLSRDVYRDQEHAAVTPLVTCSHCSLLSHARHLAPCTRHNLLDTSAQFADVCACVGKHQNPALDIIPRSAPSLVRVSDDNLVEAREEITSE